MKSQKAKDDLDRPIFGAMPIAKVANLPGGEEQAFYLLKKKRLDATKVGRLWVSTPRRILKSLGIETS